MSECKKNPEPALEEPKKVPLNCFICGEPVIVFVHKQEVYYDLIDVEIPAYEDEPIAYVNFAYPTPGDISDEWFECKNGHFTEGPALVEDAGIV